MLQKETIFAVINNSHVCSVNTRCTNMELLWYNLTKNGSALFPLSWPVGTKETQRCKFKLFMLLLSL